MKLLLFVLILLTGCVSQSIIPVMEKECRFMVIKGEGRYGSLFQYIKGDGLFIRIAAEGNGCPNEMKIDEKDYIITISKKKTIISKTWTPWPHIEDLRNVP